MADGPIRRKTEKAVRDRAGVPVGLLYDETNDKTIMARGTATGATETTLYDALGNPIAAEADHLGNYHLATTINQDVNVDPNNTSTTNLTAANSYTFTGTATSSLGVVGFQWGLKTDQNATVYIEESNDATNWDLSYAFNYIASHGGRGETIQATMAYWRIRVVLTGTTDTTYFRLSGMLCPIATPLPSALSPDGRLLVEATVTGEQNSNRHTFISPLGDQLTTQRFRLVGTAFSGSTKDTSFWTETVANGGDVTQVPGEVKLATNAVADGAARYETVHNGRFVSGSPNMFTSGVSFKTAHTANNIRRIGAYDGTEGVDGNGFYFELDNATFNLGTRKAGTDTRVASGSFNGKYGNTWVPTADTYHKLDIEYTPMATEWYVNNKVLHTLPGGHQTGEYTLPVTMECNNDSGSTSDVELHCIGALIFRLGHQTTEAIYYHISGNAATHVLKYGAGTLHKIIFNNTSGTAITIYDNTSAAAPIVGIITTASAALGSWQYNMPFSNGLTLVTTGNSLDATVVYE